MLQYLYTVNVLACDPIKIFKEHCSVQTSCYRLATALLECYASFIWNLISSSLSILHSLPFAFGLSCMLFSCCYTIFPMLDSKFPFNCFKPATALLECTIAINNLPLATNLFWMLYPVLWDLAICCHSLSDFLVLCSHMATPSSQW